MSRFRDAVRSQPENLRTAQAAFADAIETVDLERLRAGTIVFSGIGASAHAVIPAVSMLRAYGHRAFAVSPQELMRTSDGAYGDALVLVSQSGTSVETLGALKRHNGMPAIAITASDDSPLAQAAGTCLPLGPLEDTPVATLSYTATLQALGMLADALIGSSSGWREVPELTGDVLDRSEPVVQRAAESLANMSAFDAVGEGPALGAARESALLVREGLRLPAAGWETREFLHGPLEAVEDGFGSVVFGRERELKLAAELASFGASVTLITDHRVAAGSGVRLLELPRVPMLVAPILQILPVQLLVDHVARLRGEEIGALRREQRDTKVDRVEATAHPPRAGASLAGGTR
jgi:glucosamine--fructose-6-phosphate aminotransferase (isomerizing)